jgi:biopolymer transport protein ExbD
MAKRSILGEEEAPEINLSPMIDCIFILLIFFIVTTVFVDEKGLQVNKPDAAAAVSAEEKPRVALDITAENKILVGGEEVTLGEVADRVRAGVSDPETPVVIRANEKASQGVFVAVWDAARRGGAQTLSFSTIN